MIAPGTQIERYRVLRLVGQGGAASVYAVEHRDLQSRMALKVPHAGAHADREGLRREGRIQANLHSPYIVPILDLLEVDDTWGLLMPLVEGCSLADLLRDHRPSEAEIASIALDIVEALDVAHRAGVVHRDLKPANVLLQVQRGRVVASVTDFGVATSVHDPASPDGFHGTPAYAAPEQLAGDDVDLRADLWALGVVLYELFVGERPYGGRSLLELRVAQRRVVLDGVPERWRDLVRRLLQLDRQRRPPSAVHVAAALGALGFAQGLPAVGPVGLRVRPDPPPRPMAAPSTNVPPSRSAPIGRADDLAELRERLVPGAALTVLGPGGVGKTRLVRELGRTALGAYPGGVWWCELTDARTAEDVDRAVASALDVELWDGEQLGRALDQAGRALWILDDAHLGADVAQRLVAYRSAAPGAAFVVTSREVLSFDGEEVFELAPLPPEDAAALFADRARAAHRRFDPDETAQQAIGEVVRLLDGLPLAVELAARLVRTTSPVALRDRLQERLELPGAAGDTLQATLAWSFDRLDPPEQAALAQLTVFAEAFAFEAAQAVVRHPGRPGVPLAAHALEEVLHRLVDRSLLQPLGGGWFALLNTVRAHAARRDEAEVSAAEVRHGEWFAGFGAEDALTTLDVYERDQGRMREYLRVLADLRLAADRAVARGHAEVAAGAAMAAWAVIAYTGPFGEGLALLERAHALPGLPLPTRLRLAGYVGFAHQLLGHHERAGELFEAAVAEAKAQPLSAAHARSLLRLASLRAQTGRPDEANDLALHAREIAARLGHTVLESFVMDVLAWVQARREDPEKVDATYEAGLALHRALGNAAHVDYQLMNHAMFHFTTWRVQRGVELGEQALQGFLRRGDRRGEALARGNLGSYLLQLGDLDGASEHLPRALELHRHLGRLAHQAVVLRRLAELALRRQEGQRARDTCFEALALLRRSGVATWEGSLRRTFGNLCRVQGRFEEAGEHLDRALALERRSGDRRFVPVVLTALGALYRVSGRLDEAESVLVEALGATRGRPYGEGTALTELGTLRWVAADASGARSDLERALAAHLQADNPVGEALARMRLVALGAPASWLHDAEATFRRMHEPEALGLALAAQRTGEAVREAQTIRDGLGALPASELARAIAGGP